MKQLFFTMLKRLWHEFYLKTSPRGSALPSLHYPSHLAWERSAQLEKSPLNMWSWLINWEHSTEPVVTVWCQEWNMISISRFALSFPPSDVWHVWRWFLFNRAWIYCSILCSKRVDVVPLIQTIYLNAVCLSIFFGRSGFLTLPAAWFIWKEIGFD